MDDPTAPSPNVLAALGRRQVFACRMKKNPYGYWMASFSTEDGVHTFCPPGPSRHLAQLWVDRVRCSLCQMFSVTWES